MSQTSRVAKSQADEVPADIQDLATACAALPAEFCDQLQPLVQRVLDSTRRRRRILSLVQDALSQLRLDMKYLMFDLEATRRERDEYRQQLEEGRQDL
jgi:hypothetical protein